jgi:hypothetical protein
LRAERLQSASPPQVASVVVSPPPSAVIPVPAQVTEPVSEIVNVQPVTPPNAEPATLGIPATVLRNKTNKSIGASGDAVETVQTEANPSNGGLSRRPSNRRPKKKESRAKLASQDAADMENGKSSVLEEFEELRKRDEQIKWPTSDRMKKEVSPTIPSKPLLIIVRKYLEY